MLAFYPFKADKEWHRYLKKMHRREKEYYFFSVRIMSYGLCLVFFTFFFMIKVSKRMIHSDYLLALYYLLLVLAVFGLLFLDVKKFNKKT